VDQQIFLQRNFQLQTQRSSRYKAEQENVMKQREDTDEEEEPHSQVFLKLNCGVIIAGFYQHYSLSSRARKKWGMNSLSFSVQVVQSLKQTLSSK